MRSSSLVDPVIPPDGEDPPCTAEYISDEPHLLPIGPEDPDLRELNNSLEALAAIFPDVQVDVFREMLSSFDGESRLALVANALLKNKATYVKGRWRVAEKEKPSETKSGPVQRRGRESKIRKVESFRSPGYKKAAKILAWQEFKGLSRSTITAVLAEHNYSYLDARLTLVELSSKSWSFTLSSMLFRRKPVSSQELEDHPLVIWRSTGMGSIIPCLKSTGNPELDRELFDSLIVPLRQRAQAAQLDHDLSLAKSLNAEEAEGTNSTHECTCCFDSVPFEEVVSCTAEGHIVCFRCVQHSLKEAVFGQGWQANVDVRCGTLMCPAVDSTECPGHIPADLTFRALVRVKNGAEILRKFDQRLAEHSLIASDLPLIRCPFCPYAEIDDIYIPAGRERPQFRAENIPNLTLLVLCVLMAPFALPVILVVTFFALLLGTIPALNNYFIWEIHEALARFRRRRRGPKFFCLAPDCRRTSCMNCNKEWADVHVCYESELMALRTQVEQAMSMAIKRVCPRCNTSFVKASGCNKLVCPCGYKMCYVCRANIGDDGAGTAGGRDVGYRHFCQHFRPHGDPRVCAECDKCNLWESEDTARVLERAREEVERKWREAQGGDLSSAEKAYIATGVSGSYAPPPTLRALFRGGGWMNLKDVLDVVLEMLFV